MEYFYFRTADKVKSKKNQNTFSTYPKAYKIYNIL